MESKSLNWRIWIPNIYKVFGFRIAQAIGMIIFSLYALIYFHYFQDYPFNPRLIFLFTQLIFYLHLAHFFSPNPCPSSSLIYKIFDLRQGHFSDHTGLYSNSAELVNSFMELYSDSGQF
ncbi:hypothetical protein DVH24_002551 [Malus domestica]|uniref:Uncharacterized protein n=1 Tax=Malus domestica TaxID=3750 RepID=A0A498IVN6_MALDO|nr:hypothetical protein DVH24_002551 [Malus domestica]